MPSHLYCIYPHTVYLYSHRDGRGATTQTEMRLFTHLVLLSGLMAPLNVLAWGAEGHRLIAELAASRLTPEAASEVQRLLDLDGETLVTASTWADQRRSGATAPLHYLNLPEGECTYSRKRDCPDGRCVVEAIAANAWVLKSAAPDAERLVALKYLIHFVGDVHQPLHAGTARDKGGNLHQVRAFGRGSNLHAVWDGGLIQHRAGGPAQLLTDAAAFAYRFDPAVGPANWAVESCEVRQRDGFYPHDRRIGVEYASEWDGELVKRLALAAGRLAWMLNDALDRP